MKKKKSFGQHFLTDEQAAKDIVASLLLPVGEKYTVVEIGPGEGVLTKYLLKNDQLNFYAIEIDRRLPEYLEKQFPNLETRLINKDVLKVSFDEFIEGPFAIIGNLPYNISSQILFKVLEYRNQVTQMVGLFQMEVAKRVAADPGSKTYGVISILIQVYYDVDYLFTIGPESFDPPPKVQSGLIRLTRHHRHDDKVDYAKFRKVVKKAFSQRRKKISNALKGWEFDNPAIRTDWRDCRAERLSVDDYIELANTWIVL